MPTDAIYIRDPLPVPQPLASITEISFFHPGYDAPHDLLFKLPRLDQSSRPSTHSSSPGGLHHGTALAACQIVANNAFDGYLATDRAADHRVNCTYDTVLTGSRYWFFTSPDTSATLPSSAASQPPYPIVPSFQDWAFPHQDRHDEPEPDPQDGATINPRARGWLTYWPEPHANNAGRCIITQTSGLIQNAHLIPGADREWFERNAMSQYGTHHDIDQSMNKIDFRNDIYAAFDDHWFAIVPKAGRYTIHQLVATKVSAREFAHEFHNRPVLHQGFGSGLASSGLISDVSREFLYARFARAVLLLLKPFVAQSAVSRRVARYRLHSKEAEGSDETAAGPRTCVEWLSSEELHRQYGGGGTRSASPSPSKRKRGSTQGDYGDGEEVDDTESDSYRTTRGQRDSAAITTIDESLEDEIRGRPKKRRLYRPLYEEDKDQDHNTTEHGLTPPRSYASSSTSSRSSLRQALGRHEVIDIELDQKNRNDEAW
ncbi:hypothetical protein CIB48_g6524 [Xylaria polymorpha]|nr:hypothetical protein CIB48_g6524 [Xylaria polymorpha]